MSDVGVKVKPNKPKDLMLFNNKKPENNNQCNNIFIKKYRF